ncbi:HlyD family secretion protein [Shewanella submarina]|uniref:HlyD family secretion protein n=1 Tax=Shewanella submarina TaxID=2016376 RepID=A0ABV7GGV4_9GAMM|nr:HlyD family secretion protein [Shewanella submarina]
MREVIYKTLLWAVIAVAVTFSVFLVMSDNLAPFTTQATLHKSVSNIAPEVSGVVTQVAVHNGEPVQQGQLLFSIDATSYQLAVAQAQAELNKAKEDNAARVQELQAARQALAQKRTEAANSHVRLKRVQALQAKGLVSEQELDDALAATKVADSGEAAARADVSRIQAELTQSGESASVALARAKLERAQLDLSRTQIKAQSAGTVSNLQLQTGSYVKAGSPVLFVVNEQSNWLSADFNEKGITHLKPDTRVLISFDAIPGKLFSGAILSQDRAVFDASNPGNQLSTITNDNRWIREQQKVRVRIHVDGQDPSLFSGSRASVVVEDGGAIIDGLSHSWIKLVALFRYLY